MTRREAHAARARVIEAALAWLNAGIYRGGTSQEGELLDAVYALHTLTTGETAEAACERWDREAVK